MGGWVGGNVIMVKTNLQNVRVDMLEKKFEHEVVLRYKESMLFLLNMKFNPECCLILERELHLEIHLQL